ncbi:LamG-like jellyroll fold domain-containing protein [Nonomuraea sp. NPDC049784]|uniref:LamG-like jellyroll fold domain-containing protein n=1 Tax=Nonomuraea sp. NPDC049784 TaxID=3154361 RepID=UPI0033CFBC71
MAVRYAAAGQHHTTSLSLGSLTAFTVSCWVKISVDRNVISTVWTIDGGSASDYVSLRTNSDGTTVRVLIDGVSVASRTFTPGVWYFVAVSFGASGGFMTSRAEGTGTFNVDTWTTVKTVNAIMLRLGVASDDTAWLNGCLAAVKVWAAALTQAEAQAEYGDHFPQRTAGLASAHALYRTETTDYSGNRRSLSGGTGATAASSPPINWGGTPITVVTEDFEDTSYPFSLSGNWSRNSTNPQAGSWSFKSAVISDNGTTSVAITVPAGCDRLRFWYRVSSEAGYDFFRFLIGGAEQFNASGPNGAWIQAAEYTVTPGGTVTFRYTKDSSNADPVGGIDAAFIDNIEFYASTPPITPVALPAKNNFDGGMTSKQILPTTSGGVSGTAFTEVAGNMIFVDPGMRGSAYCAYNLTTTADGRMSWRYTPPAGDSICGRLYINLTGSDDLKAARAVFGLTGPSGVVSRAWIDPFTRRITVRTGDLVTGTQAVVTGTDIPYDQWARLEFRYTIDASGNGTVEVWTYLTADSLTHTNYVISPSTAWPGGKPYQADFLCWQDTTAWWTLDDVAIGATKLGPSINIAQVGRVIGSGTALPITARKIRAVGPASGVETVAVARSMRMRQLGAAGESGGAAALRPQKLRTVGQAAEAGDPARAAGAHARTLGRAGESGAAQLVIPATGPVLRAASEISAALPVTAVKVRHVGLATTTDGVQSARAVRRRLLGVAAEMSSSSLLTRVRRRGVGQAAETSRVERIGTGFVVTVVEADTALPITPLLYRGGPFTGVDGPRRTWGASLSPRGWSVDPPRRTWSASHT